MALKTVNTNDMLQLRRSYKDLSPNVCLLCVESSEVVDHIFFTLPIKFGAMAQTIQLGSYGLVPPRSICNMMSISYKGLGNMSRGKVLWKLAFLALMWVVWWEKNVRIFEDKARSSKGLWDIIFFIASFCVSCSITFKGCSP